jgi:hypothetical protein
MSKVYSVTIKNRAAAVGFSVLIVGLGVIFVTFGMALLAALAVTGTLVGAAAAIYKRLSGNSDRQRLDRMRREAGLDPSLEVQPVRPPTIAPPPSPDK